MNDDQNLFKIMKTFQYFQKSVSSIKKMLLKYGTISVA